VSVVCAHGFARPLGNSLAGDAGQVELFDLEYVRADQLLTRFHGGERIAVQLDRMRMRESVTPRRWNPMQKRLPFMKPRTSWH
jgi:hypothetical protein